jgi:hypothetical protein
MTRYHLISAVVLSVAVTLPAAAAPGSAAITTEQVAAAISGTGMSVSPEQVTLLTAVVSKSGAPTLNVQSIEPWGDRRMKVRLGCANQEECLPFYVSVHRDQKIGTTSNIAQSDQPAVITSRQNKSPKSSAVRAGSRATLLLDGGHVHIRLSVVCLESGATGQKIRVETKDPHQTYIAEVVDGGVLRGSL